MCHKKMAAVWVLIAMALMAADELERLDRERLALTELQSYIGDWRGVGQLQQGTTKGAWTEKSHWKWLFPKDGVPAFSFTIEQPRHLTSGELRYIPETNTYQLLANLQNGDALTYSGQLDEKRRLVLNTPSAKQEQPSRITISQVARGDRMLVLYERQVDDRYVRIAQVGYTREGSEFGKGTAYRECIVTGGHGTIAVRHQGETYYVCCSGCRDYFQDNPQTVLAEYQERRESAKKKQKPM